VTRPPAEPHGSALMLVLLLLLVLTGLGLLALAAVMVNVQLAANERQTTRVFHATDSGLAVALAAKMSERNEGARIEQPAGALLHTAVEATPLVPLLQAPCDLCDVGGGATYPTAQRPQLYRITYAASSRGDLLGPQDEILARSQVAAMFDVQPTVFAVDDLALLADSEAVARVKY
jgi:hypothetical protein